jgi:protein-disulfide isomerase
MMQQVYAVKLRALHEVLDQKLVEAEAKKAGVTVDDLFKAEVLSKVPDPTDDQVNAYHKDHPGQPGQTFDMEKLRQEMKSLAIQQVRSVYIQSLWQQALNNGDLILLMTMPRVSFPVDPARLRGDPKAPVTIVEFSDFSCPYCRKAESTLQALLAKYPGKVNLQYRDYPLLDLHPQAHLAAEASRCAGELGKYWEYHDLLFTSSGNQSHDDLIEDARTLKLDEKQFDACLTSGRFKTQIDQDMLLASRAAVISTPAFFINGNFISGAQPEATFENAIDEALAAAGKEHFAN